MRSYLSNNNDSEIIKVNPACDLEIVKSSSVSQANYKDIIKWTIKVSNNGPDNATGVKIIDILPNGLIYLNSTENYENNTFNIDFYGDAAITVSVGDTSARKEALMRVTEEALYKGIEQARIGNRVSDIASAVQTHAEAAIKKWQKTISIYFLI